MRYLVISDIHGNLPALAAVLRDCPPETYDRVLVLGDLVGYGAEPGPVIDRVRALVRPAMDSAGSGDATAFTALEQEIESLAREPAGAGLDVPDWLAALEEEVSLVRCAKRHREAGDDILRRLAQTRLGWEELQQQLVREES